MHYTKSDVTAVRELRLIGNILFLNLLSFDMKYFFKSTFERKIEKTSNQQNLLSSQMNCSQMKKFKKIINASSETNCFEENDEMKSRNI